MKSASVAASFQFRSSRGGEKGAKREEEKSRREGERKTSVPAVAGADKKS